MTAAASACGVTWYNCTTRVGSTIVQLYISTPCHCALGLGKDGEILNATPVGLAEQAAGGGGCQKNTLKAKQNQKNPPGEKPENFAPEPPGRLAQDGEKGSGGGKEEVADEGSAEALAVRVAQRGHEVSEQFFSQLGLLA